MVYKCRLYVRSKISKRRWTTDTKRPLSRYSMGPRSGVKGLRKTVSTALAGLRIPPSISVLRIISRISNKCMRSALSGPMGFTVPICGP